MTLQNAIGIDVGGTGTKGGIVDSAGRVIERAKVATDKNAGTKGILEVADRLLEHARRESIQVDAIGVGAAGFIDSAKGCVTFSPNLVYDDPDLGNAIHSHTGMKAFIDNDANAAAWGERNFGTAQGFDHVAMLTLGTGVGSGFVVEGRLLRGATGAGAEFGHVVIDPNGPECPCGLRGCLEQFASGGAIGRMGRVAAAEDPQSSMVAFAGSVDKITALDVARAAREYDQTARRVLRDAGVSLAIGLSNIVNVFDPQVIVLGGTVVEAGEAYLGPARDGLASMTSAQRRRPVRLDVSKLGHDAGIVGAAALALTPSP
ncbi:MAG: glucokinase [Actinomycetota bacterium]|jgi:glucokinase|nr:glucokinase [Actinomycetota bacterium]